MAAESASKTCVVCGQDVAGKPRVKDAAGRYMCAGACHEKAAAAAKQRAGGGTPAPPPKAPPVARPMGDGNVLGGLIAASPMLNSAMCTECGNPMPGGAVLCTRCGFNTQTGKSLRTAVIRDKQAKEPKGAGGKKYSNPHATSDFGPSFGVLFLTVAGVIGALGALGFVNPLFIAIALLVAGFVHMVGFVWGFVDAVRQGETMYAVVGFFIGIVFLYYMLAVNEMKWSKALYLGSLVGGVIALAILFGGLGGDLDSLASGKLGN